MRKARELLLLNIGLSLDCYPTLSYDVNFFERFMNICLKTYAKNARSHTVKLRVHERMPTRVSVAPELTCIFHIEDYSNYYMLTLDVCGSVSITCQRCLGSFQHEYINRTQLAVCGSEALAETLMDDFECVVVCNNELNLIDTVTDELHLFLPEKHADIASCSLEICEFINDKN